MSHNTPDLSQLPFLLRLIDDPSPVVSEKIARVLRAYGPALPLHIQELGLSLTPRQRVALDKLLSVDDATLRTAWLNWINSTRRTQLSDTRRLENGLDLLARWQLGREHPVRLSELLDNLAEEFLSRDALPCAEDLSIFLFEEKGLHGAPADDYYNPLNSNLVWAIENGQGLPITLACIFILVGERVDLKIQGCNFPGHFMASAREDHQDLVFDCFNNGRLLSAREVAALRKVAPHELEMAPSSVDIMTRTLHNLVKAYRQSDEEAKLQFVYSLLTDLQHINAGNPTL
jgi:regulator of sirC expression with transglutaminase-like and TPR domain